MPDAAASPVVPIDQPTLLTAAILRLTPGLHTAEVRKDRLVVKYDAGRQYLVVTPHQWGVLQYFSEGRSVPAVLFEIISDRHCPPLREFYELVLKAFSRGILQADGQPLPPPEPASRWRAKARGRLARWLALAAMAAAVVTLLLYPLEMPENTGQLLLGWLLTCVATSVGWALAACVLRGAGGEVYRPRFAWKTLAPHFHADLDDAAMTGRDAEIDVALTRLAPQFVFAAVAAPHLPGLLLPQLCGILFQLSPLWPSPVLSLLRALYHDPQLSTTFDFQFLQHRLFTVLLRARLKFADRKFLLACAGYTLAWSALVFLTGCALLRVNAFELFRRFQAAGGLHFTALALLATFALMAFWIVAMLVWTAWHHFRAWRRERALRRRKPIPAELTPANVFELLRRTALFGSLPADELAGLGAAVQPEEHAAGTYVIREGEQGDRLYIVFSGRVEVLREEAIGPPEPIATLQAGDIFGEIALLGEGRRTRSVRCAEPSLLLALDQADFRALVLSRFSREAIAQAVQKTGFLNRAELSSHWSPYARSSFAQRASFQDFSAGTVIIEEGANNQFFHLIHTGEMSVRKQGQEIARLGPGAFFGEIGLLLNISATATVVARTPGRCLLLSKHEFLQFITKDFLIGIQFEDVASKRLGAPLFRATASPAR